MPELTRTRTLLYGLLVVLGFSFWFLLGFPFANHNESFVIVTQLEQMTLGDALTDRIYPVANYRPFGQAVAWVGYHLSNKTVSGVQVFNYAVAVLAWLVLFVALRERRIFSYAAFVVGGFFFSGYIYLFHLHGVFYSPLLVLIAVLFLLETRPVTVRLLWLVTVTAVIAAFFHPYALPIFLAALAGFAVERRREFAAFWRLLVGAGTGALALLVVMVILPSHERAMTAGEMLAGLVTSYRMVEVNGAVAAVALAFVVLTAWSCPVSHTARWLITGLGLAGAGVAWSLGIPLILVWIAVTLVKMVLMRKWWLVLVIGGTALLPAPAASGSPTYTIFVVMACTGALALSWTGAEARVSTWRDWVVLAPMTLTLAVLVLVRSGVEVPKVTPLVRPVLAEREKTHQLEEIVRWLTQSHYAGYEPVLLNRSGNPRDATDAVDRTHRSPTVQEYLSKYARYKRGSEALPEKVVFIGFGGEELAGGTLVHAVEAPHAGPARVYLPPPR